jgi:hypothetical protein
MACGSKEAGGAYRPRHPQQTPFLRLPHCRRERKFQVPITLLWGLCRAGFPPWAASGAAQGGNPFPGLFRGLLLVSTPLNAYGRAQP